MERFRGLNGTIVLKEDSVQILREGGIDSTFHDQNRIVIPYSEIKDIQYVAGSLVNGYLSIIRTGTSRPTGIIKAMKDDTTVIFRMFKNGQAEKLVKEIKQRL